MKSERDSFLGMFRLDHAWLIIALTIHILYHVAFQYDRSFWRDEAHAWNLSSATTGEFLRLFAFVEHQTSYLVFLRFIYLLGGTIGTAALFSMVCAIGGAFCIYLVITRYIHLPGNKTLALNAATLSLLAHPLLHYSSHVIRPYSFAFLLQTLVCLLAFKAYANFRRSTIILLFFIILLSVNAQPVNLVAAYGVAATWGLACLIDTRRNRVNLHDWRLVLLKLFSVPIMTIACSVPMLIQSTRFSRAMKGVEPASEIGSLSINVFMKLIWQPVQGVATPIYDLYMFAFRHDPYINLIKLTQTPATLILLFIMLAITGILCWRLIFRDRRFKRLLPVVFYFAVTTAGLSLASIFHIRMIEVLRSFSALGPSAICLSVWLIYQLRAWHHIVIFVIVMNAVVGFPSFSERRPGDISDARSVAEKIMDEELASDLILLANAQLGPSFALHYHGNLDQVCHPYGGSVPYWDMVELSRLADQPQRIEATLELIENARRNNRRVWFITSGSPAPEPERFWYSPNSLITIENKLTESFDNLHHQTHRSRLEPMDVTLYAPR